MLEWMIAVGALSGAIAGIGVLYIAIDFGLRLRRRPTGSGELPRARVHRIVRR